MGQRGAHTVSQGAAHTVERADLLLSKECRGGVQLPDVWLGHRLLEHFHRHRVLFRLLHRRVGRGAQDQLEKEDTLLITKFVWLMQKKTTVGIHRFEDLIHKEFQELVEMGYLKLKPNASKPNSPNS